MVISIVSVCDVQSFRDPSNLLTSSFAMNFSNNTIFAKNHSSMRIDLMKGTHEVCAFVAGVIIETQRLVFG